MWGSKVRQVQHATSCTAQPIAAGLICVHPKSQPNPTQLNPLQVYPVTFVTLNWSAPILGMALAFALGWYYLPGPHGARKWFTGGRANAKRKLHCGVPCDAHEWSDLGSTCRTA